MLVIRIAGRADSKLTEYRIVPTLFQKIKPYSWTTSSYFQQPLRHCQMKGSTTSKVIQVVLTGVVVGVVIVVTVIVLNKINKIIA
jgi:hypothetical protein